MAVFLGFQAHEELGGQTHHGSLTMEVAGLSIGMKTLSGYKSNSQNCSACLDMSEAVSKTGQCPKLVPQNIQCPVTNCARKSLHSF